MLSGIGSGSGCLGLKTISSPFLKRSRTFGKRGSSYSGSFFSSFNGTTVDVAHGLLQLHGEQGAQGRQGGHEQHGGGVGGAHGLQFPEQQFPGHLGGH